MTKRKIPSKNIRKFSNILLSVHNTLIRWYKCISWKIICKLYVILIIQFLHNNFCLDLQYIFEEELFWQICIWCIIMCGLWTSQKIHHTLSTVHLVCPSWKRETISCSISFSQWNASTQSEIPNVGLLFLRKKIPNVQLFWRRKNKIRRTIYSILTPLEMKSMKCIKWLCIYSH